MKKIFSFLALAFIIPWNASAQAATDLRSLLQVFINLLGVLMTVLYAAAFVAFFWGIVQYILNTDNPTERQKGTQWMIWSVVALSVMVSLWGIVGILIRTFGLTPQVIPQLGT